MHTLEQKIEALVNQGFKNIEGKGDYYTDYGICSFEILDKADIQKIRKSFKSLYLVVEPVDKASQELIDAFGEEKALWLETAGLKKFDKPIMCFKGQYLLSEDYIRETPLEKLIEDVQKINDYISVRHLNNVPFECKQANQESSNEKELTERLTNLLESLIQEMPALKILPKSVLNVVVKNNLKKIKIGDYDRFDEVLRVFENRLKV